MELRQVLSLSCRQELSCRNGATRSVFPRVERWLDRDSDRHNAWTILETRADPEDFRDTMDWLLVSTFPGEEDACMAFYAEEGKQMRFIISEARRKYYEHILLGVMRGLYAEFCRRRSLEWDWTDEEAAELCERVLLEVTVEAVMVYGIEPGVREGKTRYA